jgi:K+-transporting ATPase ATPase A chain
MSDTVAGLLTVLALVVVLGVTHVPLGDYMARVYSATHHWRAEQLVYRACRIDPDADQTWATYALSVLGFSLASVLFLFGLERLQHVRSPPRVIGSRVCSPRSPGPPGSTSS